MLDSGWIDHIQATLFATCTSNYFFLQSPFWEFCASYRWHRGAVCKQDTGDHWRCSYFLQEPGLVHLLSPDSVYVSVIINSDTWSVSFCEGGFDLLGRSIDQIRTTKQVNSAMATCRSLNLDGLVIIGGKLIKFLTKSGDCSFPKPTDIWACCYWSSVYSVQSSLRIVALLCCNLLSKVKEPYIFS